MGESDASGRCQVFKGRAREVGEPGDEVVRIFDLIGPTDGGLPVQVDAADRVELMRHLDSIHTTGRLGIFVDRLDAEVGHKEKVVAIIVWSKRCKFPLEGEEAKVKRSVRV